MKKKLLIVVNDAEFFLSHRLPVALGARDAGFEVHVATMPGLSVETIVRNGLEHHTLPLTRSGRNPLVELRAFFSILQLFRRLKPDVVHLVTIKPVLYGGIAARLARVPGVVAAVSGLGFIFMARGRKASLFRWAIAGLYRLAFGKKNLKAIFQNPDDRDVFVDMNAIEPSKVMMLRGSGVDLSTYLVEPEPTDTPVVCLAARLLRDKGIYEFVEAARQLRRAGVHARFVLAGDADSGNPTAISEEQLAEWSAERIVELIGYVNDIPSLFSKANIVVLPSYREGLPKVLVEAAACGRAVITTDVPGCRHAVEPNVTGVLVPVRDSHALAEAIKTLLSDPMKRKEMGAAGRELAEREYAIDKIVQEHVGAYNSLLSGVNSYGA